MMTFKKKEKPTSKLSILEGKLVEEAYKKNNYLIEYTHHREKNKSDSLCAIYFSSSGIYYPNNDEAFEKAFFKEDKYEWYNTRVDGASKHIFLRDIYKQFYVLGINREINTIEKILQFLEKETEGYDIITVGSSAGAYMALIAGCHLKAKIVFNFSGYFDMKCIDYEIWPFVKKYLVEKKSPYINLSSIAEKTKTKIVYIYPTLLLGDCLQAEKLKITENIFRFPIKSKIHGIPFKSYFVKTIVNIPIDHFMKIANNHNGKIYTKNEFLIQCIGVTKLIRIISLYYIKKLNFWSGK